MTVYIDDMHRYPIGEFRVGRYTMKMSHMIADTEEELHAMAARIGVARRWYQDDHYDVSLAKRALAVKAGAVEITYRQYGLMASNRRATGSLGDPATAKEVWAARRRLAKQGQAGSADRAREPA
ncbi:hypothetical protein ACVIGB_000890 [Bradyrhizobium sp. USDA 4341]